MADLMRADYGKLVMPLAVLRQLDCVLEPIQDAVNMPE
jgi:hypothetical protein